MEFKAIIFDMDGTIIDTTDIWDNAVKNLIKSKGVNCTPEMFAQINELVHGLAIDKACKIIKDISGIDDPVELLIKEKQEIAIDLYCKGIKFIEGFELFHEQISQRSIKNAIATNADNHTLQITKDVLKIDNFFGHHIYNISHVDYICKPDPAIYLHAAKQLEVHPEQCIAIEDSAHGVRAAKRAGMYCIGINTSGNLDQLKEADYIINGYCDIDLNNIKKIIS